MEKIQEYKIMTVMTEKQRKIEFQFNKQKAIEAILYFSNAKNNLSVMHLLKFLFYADLYHLEKYDRPIIGDVYYAMKKGPVASNVYELLKQDCNDYELYSKDFNLIKYIHPKRQADLKYFSRTDLEAMDYVLNTYKDLSPEQLSTESHKTKAWKNAWDKKNFLAKRELMDYADFYESGLSDEKLEYLLENSKLMVF